MNILLTVIKMIGAVALQFQKAPHWVEHTYSAEGVTVNISSTDGSPSCSSCSGEKKGKDHLTINLGVPTNGGINQVFGAEFNDDAQAKFAAYAIRDAIESANAAASAEILPEVV